MPLDLAGTDRGASQNDIGFELDQLLHLNDPSWFRPPVLYGFLFSRPEVLPFRRLPGNVRFFRVSGGEPGA